MFRRGCLAAAVLHVGVLDNMAGPNFAFILLFEGVVRHPEEPPVVIVVRSTLGFNVLHLLNINK